MTKSICEIGASSWFYYKEICHDARPHVTMQATCHDARPHVTMQATCHEARSHVTMQATCHEARSHVTMQATCHDARSHERKNPNLIVLIIGYLTEKDFAIVDTFYTSATAKSIFPDLSPIIPVQAWTGPWNSRRLRLPGLLDNRHMEVARLLALRTGRLYPQEKLVPTNQ